MRRKADLLWVAGLLILPSALAFLTLAHRLGFYNDDWFLIYPIKTQGLETLHTIFAGDRPARAYLVQFFYRLFGDTAPLYSYSAYFFHLVGAAALYWALAQIWREKRAQAGAAALLFLIYPGFLDQVNAFDFQSHMVSLALGMLSIALSVRAALPDVRPAQRILPAAASALLIPLYLSLIEYYIGLEGLRFLLLGALVLRGCVPDGRVITLLKAARARSRELLAAWGPAVVMLAVFLLWRTLIFNNQRDDTNIAGMLSGLASSPLRAAWMMVYLLQDMVNVLFFAWAVPPYMLTSSLRLRDFLLAAAVAAAAATVAVWCLHRLAQGQNDAQPLAQAEDDWPLAWAVIGAGAVLISLLPIVLGNRHVIFNVFNRFTLPGSAGAALALVGLLSLARRRSVFLWGTGLLVWVAALTQFANTSAYAQEWATVRNLWWQAAWRAPSLYPGTTIILGYPGGWPSQDYIAWGPANLIYYPEHAPVNGGTLPLAAAAIYPDTFTGLVTGARAEVFDRGMRTEKDFTKTLLLWQPTAESCLRVMDPNHPDLPAQVDERFSVITPYSQIKQVDADASPVAPPTSIFGPEPERGWCYFYQQAALARQKADWAAAARLGDQAQQAGLRPGDRAEWLPFIQAYVMQGELDKADGLIPILQEVPLLRAQACRQFSATDSLNGPAREYLTQAFCR